MTKPVIAVDIDDVLFPFVEGVATHYNKLKGTKLSAADFTTYNFDEVFGGTRQEANEVVETFLAKDNIDLLPVAGAKEALEQISRDYTIVLVTARNGRFSDSTVGWLRHHLGELFEDVVFAGNEFDGQSFRAKHDICQQLGAKLIIDDHPGNVLPCAERGIDGILFSDRIWSAERSVLPGNVVRAGSWPEVVEYIYASWRRA